MAFSYSKPEVPTDYACGECGADACKLWRVYNGFMPRLYCVDCAAASECVDVSSIDADGRTMCNDLGCGGDTRSDSIGFLVPAVPTEDNKYWWGYTSVTDAGIAWWRSLPTRKR